MRIPAEAIKHYRRGCEFKRLEVMCSLLREGDRVLDVGCGIGSYSSNPLSWLPVEIKAIDSDFETIKYANERNTRKNLEFAVVDGETFKSDKLYDLIICSHVLEHTLKPKTLLNNMRTLLEDDGILYVGLPNGFGAFEVQNALPRLMFRTRWGRDLISSLWKVKDTLNVDSQHVQFFRVGRAKRLLEDCGWKIVDQINDEFLGGIVFDRLFAKIPLLVKWNVAVAKKIPAQLANGWIFVCKKSF